MVWFWIFWAAPWVSNLSGSAVGRRFEKEGEHTRGERERRGIKNGKRKRKKKKSEEEEGAAAERGGGRNGG